MTSQPRSHIDDLARLDALARYEIMDTPPEALFDDIVSVARTLCSVPVALISLLDQHRQWFKARSGFDGSGTPIEQSICAHALSRREILVIPDLTKDVRTSGNTLVSGEPKIRFYAGAPLITPEGHILGTLCIVDVVPRPEGLTAEQVDSLEALARHTMVLMELRRLLGDQGQALTQAQRASTAVLDRARASEEAGERLRQDAARAIAAQEAGRIGTFDVDLATDLVRTSPEMCRIYGLPEAQVYAATTFEPLAVEEDQGLRSTVRSRRDGSAAPAVEYRIRRITDGAVRWISRRGEFIRDERGRPRRFVGTIHDVTERRLIELRQSALLSLGDQTRDMSSTAEVIGAAARILGNTLDAARVGYAEMDLAGGTFTVERDWTASGVPSIQGRYALALESPALARLKAGETVVADLATELDWLFGDVPEHLVAGTGAQIKIPLARRGDLVGVLFVHSAKARRWSRDELGFTASLADRTYAAIAKVQAERDQHLLNEELSHRLKNNLAMVQAIAKQTLKSAQDRPAVEALNQRLVALGAAHDVLLRQSWKAAPILSVVEHVIALHGEPSRFELQGPNLSLGARTVLSLSMLLHELATNALKHGSLSTDRGRVLLDWSVERGDPPTSFVLSWTEAGAPL